MAGRGKGLNVPLRAEERERISQQAEARNLSDSSFIKLLALGAIARGGGTVEQLLMAGETQTESFIRKRNSRNFEELWTRVGPGRHVWNDWIIIKTAPHGTSKGEHDESKWWWLHHRSGRVAPRPVAFTRREAFEKAVYIIERIEHDERNDERNQQDQRSTTGDDRNNGARLP